MRLLAALAVCLLIVPHAVHAQLPLFGQGPRLPVYATEARDRLPEWMALPRQARLSLGDDLRFVPVHNSAMSFENLKLGVLVGALRNEGDCASGLGARLQYVDAAWQPVGPPIPNEARVSRVEPGGLYPFRFRLRTLAPAEAPPVAYVIVIEEDARPLADPFTWNRWVRSSDDEAPTRQPCDAPAVPIDVQTTTRQSLHAGFVLGGTLTLAGTTSVRADGVVLTALLRDAQGQVLEVLVGTPAFRERTLTDGALQPRQPAPFRLRTDIPVGHDVTDVDVFVEVLPDSIVAEGPP